MHTEEQAKALWCPHGRIAVASATLNDPALLNGPKGGDYACNCIASNCAAWRWAEAHLPRGITHRDRKGYCGLAGKGSA